MAGKHWCVAEYKARMRAGDPAYAPNAEHDALVELLFPEVTAAHV